MPRARPIVPLLLALCLLAPVRAQQARPQPPPYRILISNDDGVRAPGIAMVAQTLQAIGQVIKIGRAHV